MIQYLSVKKEYPDSILLFRLGDFYEMFYDDAKTASEILGIALTSRDRSKKIRCLSAEFPSTARSPTYQSFSEAGRKWLSANRWATRRKREDLWIERS